RRFQGHPWGPLVLVVLLVQSDLVDLPRLVGQGPRRVLGFPVLPADRGRRCLPWGLGFPGLPALPARLRGLGFLAVLGVPRVRLDCPTTRTRFLRNRCLPQPDMRSLRVDLAVPLQGQNQQYPP